MKKMILLFSHELSEKQTQEATQVWHVDEFISLPKHLQNLWSDISPDIKSIERYILPIKEFMLQNANEGDIVLIQGDFGAVYALVNFSKEHRLTPIYATTKRKIEEYIDNEGKKVKKSIFEHRRFREYG